MELGQLYERDLGLCDRTARDLVALNRRRHVLEDDDEIAGIRVPLGVEARGRTDRHGRRKLLVEANFPQVVAEGQGGRPARVIG